MKTIDSHIHLWEYNATEYSWITDEMDVLQHNFLPAQLPSIPAYNSLGFVAVQARQAISETHFLLDLAKKHEEIIGVVGWLDLCTKDFEDELTKWIHHKKLKGLRHILQEEEAQFFKNSVFIENLRLLQHYNLVYDILIYEHQIEDALSLLNKLPNQKFVLNHLAKPTIKSGISENWKDGIKEMAKHPNLYCKISGLVTEAEWHQWTAEDFEPFLDTVFTYFETDRILFGSDWPVCLLSSNYENVVRIIEKFTKNFSEKEKEMLWYKNAARAYKLNIE